MAVSVTVDVMVTLMVEDGVVVAVEIGVVSIQEQTESIRVDCEHKELNDEAFGSNHIFQLFGSGFVVNCAVGEVQVGGPFCPLTDLFRIVKMVVVNVVVVVVAVVVAVVTEVVSVAVVSVTVTVIVVVDVAGMIVVVAVDLH